EHELAVEETPVRRFQIQLIRISSLYLLQPRGHHRDGLPLVLDPGLAAEKAPHRVSVELGDSEKKNVGVVGLGILDDLRQQGSLPPRLPGFRFPAEGSRRRSGECGRGAAAGAWSSASRAFL